MNRDHDPSTDVGSVESESIDHPVDDQTADEPVSREQVETPTAETVTMADESEPIMAELATDVAVPGAFHGTPQYVQPAALPPAFQNLSAVGGAVGSAVLGVWSILGSLITPYSGIVAVLGLLFGIWGTSSPRRWLAAVGLALSIVGLIMSVFEVSNILSDILNAQDDSL